MFNSIVIRLIAKNTGILYTFPAQKLHAVFLKLIEESSKELSKELHSQTDLKAFTISSFLGLKDDDGYNFNDGENYYIRITTLDENIFRIVTANLFKKKVLNNSIFLENIEFMVKHINLDNEKSKWSGIFDLDEVIKNKTNKIFIKFCSPTYFKNGDKFIRFPEPKRVFTSLLKKYNKYSLYKLDGNIINKFDEIDINKINIRKQKINMNKFYAEGFVGTVEFSVDKNDKELLEIINILSSFSFYGGIGAKTTMGFGQVMRLN